RRDMVRMQERTISDLQEKLGNAPEVSSDEFMYQDHAEVEKEITVAQKLLTDVPSAIDTETLTERCWNVLEYKRYRGADND
ncbi:MAG TPA: sulfate adenylyltransferase, partial [Oligella sp.]|nr:sulfate adenylyltransferase [Oligella sp.]